ncbi:MAG: glycosyltransferase family 4 protein [Methylomonas sp.]|jgi:glycosyltransferase involved in cell wall biosynthesis
MRILIFIYSLGNGGAERVAANLANHWAKTGKEVIIVTLAPQSHDSYRLDPAIRRISLELAVNSNHILAGLFNNIRRIAALRKLLRQLRPDIALGMMSTANVLLSLAAWGLPNLRTIGAEHIHPPKMSMGYAWTTIRKIAYGLLNAVTVLTGKTRNWIEKNTDAKEVFVIPNPINWPLVSESPRIEPRAICPPNRHILLAVGRLHMQKGFDWLIESFCRLAPKYPDWDLVILGEGLQRGQLETLISESGFDERIFLPGQTGNVGEWYDIADVFVMSSRFEGFPNVLVEAMGYGLPVVSFDCDTGPGDIIRNDYDGLLVPADDVAALTASLDKIMGDPALRLRLAQQALEVRTRFSPEKIAEMWEDLFLKLLSKQI